MAFKKNKLLTLIFLFIATGHAQIKILHLSFHKGCIDDFEYVSKQLGLNLTSWFILDSYESGKKFYGKEYDLNIYNIRHEDAERIWNYNKAYFNTFDAIITSDTVPLCRIFLQNGWQKPLIIWICNRFDNRGGYDKNCIFPDNEFYDLMRKACCLPNVFIASYTPYEQEYALTKGIVFPSLIIRPTGLSKAKADQSKESLIPEHINKPNTLYLAPRFYHQSHKEYVIKKCTFHGIKIYAGKYNGPDDLIGFKGVLHFPYQASTLAFFESLHRGLVYFVPSATFIKEILQKDGDVIPHFWHAEPLNAERGSEFWHSEFYRPEYEPLIVYFNSWQDLKEKIETTNYKAQQAEIRAFASWHAQTMIGRWSELFKKVTQFIKDSHNEE